MSQHRPILLLENVASNLNSKIWPDPEDVLVKCCVMDLAQGNPIGYAWFPPWMLVGKNVSRIQELRVLEPTDRAGLSVGSKNTRSKILLVKSLDGNCGDVSSPSARV